MIIILIKIKITKRLPENTISDLYKSKDIPIEFLVMII